MPTEFQTRDGLTVHPDFAEPLAAAGLASLEAVLQTPGDDDLHKPGLAGWRQRLRLKLPAPGGGEPAVIYLKRYTKPPLKEQWANRKQGHADCAAVEWHWLTELDRLGVPGPVPVLYGSKRRRGLEAASVMATAAVPGEALERWVPRQLGPGGTLADRATKLRLIAMTADLVAKLHGQGLIHRDLYLAHLFLDPRVLAPGSSDADPGDASLPGGITLIDLQRMIRPRLRWRRWVVKDLSALNYSTPADAASTADRVRWFRRYRGLAGDARLSPDDKALIRAVVAKTGRVARHDAKRNKRLK